MDGALDELLGFLKASNPAVRAKAVATVLSLTGTDEGRKLLLASAVPGVLCRLVGDAASGSAENAVKSLINLSADGELMQSMLKEGMVTKLMESLRDTDCTWKRYVVMLLANLSQTDEGCIQLMQLHDAAAPLKGLHLRRLVQYFVGPVAVPPGCRYSPTGDSPSESAWDPFEYAGDIIANVTRLDEARKILLEPERRILPVLFPQLLSPSVVRRRGAACALRNCCFEKSEPAVRYMLSPSVDLVTALLQPLVGPDHGQYAAEDRDFMNPALFKNAASKRREHDPAVRRQLLESLLLLAGTRMARDQMRRVRVYPIVKAFHQWLEGAEEGEAAAGGAGAGAGKDATGGGDIVGARDEDDLSQDGGLHPDDEAGVEAINRLVQQLFREDEYVWPSAAAGAASGAAGGAAGAASASAAQRAARPTAAPQEDAGAGLVPTGAGQAGAGRKPVDETQIETLAGRGDKAALRAAAERRMQRFAVVPEAQARAKAAGVARGQDHVAAVPEEELESVRTKVPDWTEDDPELPEAFRPKQEEGTGAAAAGGDAAAPTVAKAGGEA